MKFIELNEAHQRYFKLTAEDYRHASIWHRNKSLDENLPPEKREFHRRAAADFRNKTKTARQAASFDWRKFCEAHQQT